jgi:DNA-binding transcriptional MocR family regulator
MAAQLILALIERMEPGSGGVVVASRTTMGELIGASIATVRRALATLTEEGWVQRIRIGGVSALAINHRVAWVGSRADIQHAVFGATVIASRSEQDALSLSPPPTRHVPMLRPGEMPLMFGQADPPSQPDLDGILPVVAMTADVDTDGVISDRRMAELEAVGQRRTNQLETLP